MSQNQWRFSIREDQAESVAMTIILTKCQKSVQCRRIHRCDWRMNLEARGHPCATEPLGTPTFLLWVSLLNSWGDVPELHCASHLPGELLTAQTAGPTQWWVQEGLGSRHLFQAPHDVNAAGRSGFHTLRSATARSTTPTPIVTHLSSGKGGQSKRDGLSERPSSRARYCQVIPFLSAQGREGDSQEQGECPLPTLRSPPCPLHALSMPLTGTQQPLHIPGAPAGWVHCGLGCSIFQGCSAEREPPSAPAPVRALTLSSGAWLSVSSRSQATACRRMRMGDVPTGRALARRPCRKSVVYPACPEALVVVRREMPPDLH